MDTIAVNQRVMVAANNDFHGVVTRIDDGGAGGCVHFDADTENPEKETYFAAGELEPEVP